MEAIPARRAFSKVDFLIFVPLPPDEHGQPAPQFRYFERQAFLNYALVLFIWKQVVEWEVVRAGPSGMLATVEIYSRFSGLGNTALDPIDRCSHVFPRRESIGSGRSLNNFLSPLAHSHDVNF